MNKEKKLARLSKVMKHLEYKARQEFLDAESQHLKLWQQIQSLESISSEKTHTQNCTAFDLQQRLAYLQTIEDVIALKKKQLTQLEFLKKRKFYAWQKSTKQVSIVAEKELSYEAYKNEKLDQQIMDAFVSRQNSSRPRK